MGNSTSTTTTAEEELEPEIIQTPSKVDLKDDDGYVWPKNLYMETRDMASISFLIYTFGYAVDVARKVGLKGLQQTNDGQIVHDSIDDEITSKEEKNEKEQQAVFDLPRSFTPNEILQILTDNYDVLSTQYPKIFSKNPESESGGEESNTEEIIESNYDKIITNLQAMQERIEEAQADGGGGESIESSRPLQVVEYDDRHQQHELVYAITKDDINKRITLVFRGTDNTLAFGSNWTTNLSMNKTQAIIPKLLESVIPPVDTTSYNGFYTTGGMWIHSGFYNYIFNLTKDDDDPITWRKYDEIVKDLKSVFDSNPKYSKEYKLYVTGHSLGAALSTVVAFYLACGYNGSGSGSGSSESDDSDAVDMSFIPKPITCINFASPRVGDGNFLNGIQHLEEHGLLRMLRIVNDNDSIAFAPMTNYHHVGFQARLYKMEEGEGGNYYQPDPILTYHTSKKETWDQYWDRMWNNSLPASFNLSYDHGDYRERVDQNKDFFEKLHLKSMYKNSALTGF